MKLSSTGAAVSRPSRSSRCQATSCSNASPACVRASRAVEPLSCWAIMSKVSTLRSSSSGARCARSPGRQFAAGDPPGEGGDDPNALDPGEILAAAQPAGHGMLAALGVGRLAVAHRPARRGAARSPRDPRGRPGTPTTRTRPRARPRAPGTAAVGISSTMPAKRSCAAWRLTSRRAPISCHGVDRARSAAIDAGTPHPDALRLCGGDRLPLLSWG